jgi:uncharacterized damage-inducible protein DinB
MPAARASPERRVQALLAEMRATRRAVLEAARSFPPALQDAPCVGVWSVKDVLAHLVGWDETNCQALDELAAGIFPSFYQFHDADWQSFNARLVQTYRVEPFSALLEAAEASHRRLCEQVLALTAETLLSLKAARPGGKRTISARYLLDYEARDDRVHTAQLEAFLRQQHPGL